MAIDPTPVVRTLSGSTYRALGEFFVRNGSRPQVFRINPARRTTLVGQRGLRMNILPLSFVDSSGQPVRDEVEIQLIEIPTWQEMVLSDMVTISDDRLLESAGMFFIQAVRQYVPLELCQPLSVELPVAAAVSNPMAMHLFAGSTSATRPFAAGGNFDWKLVGERSLKVRKQGPRKFFTFELMSFNWYSCSYVFSRNKPRTMVSIRTVCPVKELDEQVAMLVFRDLNSVARMYPAGQRFTLFNVPVNLPARALVFGLHGGQLYFGQEELQRTSGQLVYVKMYGVKEAEMTSLILDR